MKVKKNNRFESLPREKRRRAIMNRGGVIEHDGTTYIVHRVQKKRTRPKPILALSLIVIGVVGILMTLVML